MAFCDSVLFGRDRVHIFDLYQNKIVKTWRMKYVDETDALKFIHNDTKLLIATWEGVYAEELHLP